VKTTNTDTMEYKDYKFDDTCIKDINIPKKKKYSVKI